MGTKVICTIARVRGEAGLGTGYVYEAIAHAHAYVHAQTLQHARPGRTLESKTIVQLSGLKPVMLISSVQAVVACYATASRVCISVLLYCTCCSYDILSMLTL